MKLSHIHGTNIVNINFFTFSRLAELELPAEGPCKYIMVHQRRIVNVRTPYRQDNTDGKIIRFFVKIIRYPCEFWSARRSKILRTTITTHLGVIFVLRKADETYFLSHYVNRIRGGEECRRKTTSDFCTKQWVSFDIIYKRFSLSIAWWDMRNSHHWLVHKGLESTHSFANAKDVCRL